MNSGTGVVTIAAPPLVVDLFEPDGYTKSLQLGDSAALKQSVPDQLGPLQDGEPRRGAVLRLNYCVV